MQKFVAVRFRDADATNGFVKRAERKRQGRELLSNLGEELASLLRLQHVVVLEGALEDRRPELGPRLLEVGESLDDLCRRLASLNALRWECGTG